MLTPDEIADDAKWLAGRASVAIFLLAPDIWDEALASVSWKGILAALPATLKARMSARVAAVNAAVTEALRDAPNAVAIDRTALLRAGEVQEHTHVSRRASVAVAEAVVEALGRLC